jgi:hypothetical protein
MDRVEEIEAAIEGLPPEEFRRLARWVDERLQRDWDLELDTDSASGKLDFLFEAAHSESANQQLRQWPPPR